MYVEKNYGNEIYVCRMIYRSDIHICRMNNYSEIHKFIMTNNNNNNNKTFIFTRIRLS